MKIHDVIRKAIKDYSRVAPMDRSLIEKALKDAGFEVSFEELRRMLVLMKSMRMINYYSDVMEDGEGPMSNFRLR